MYSFLIIAKFCTEINSYASIHSYIFRPKEYNIYGSILPQRFLREVIKVTVNDAVAKRVNQLLKEKNMTQYRLEQTSGIQHGHMQWIMSGKSKTVTLSTAMMLANGFGMTIIEFLDDEMFLFENLEVE